MTHDEIRARLLGALDRTLDPHELDEVERHMAGCDACRLEQVELFRMRRSLDREEAARERLAPRRPAWAPLGIGGTLRVLALLVFMGAALAVALRQHGKKDVRAPAPHGAHLHPLGPGVLAGPAGAAAGVRGDVPLAAGDEVWVPQDARAIVSLGQGRRVAMQGPAGGLLLADGLWRVLSGRHLAHATGTMPQRLAPEAGRTLVLASGFLAVEPGAAPALIDGNAMADGTALPTAAAPAWAEALTAAFLECDAVDVIPCVRVFPAAPEGVGVP